ncbi:MFS transporter [Amycolatopsis sp. NPDC059027]|uniref:MFS transporter n=1 Tax=unclassified Amycolatopsis TaxID=2618356 RepID=UPI00366D1B35
MSAATATKAAKIGGGVLAASVVLGFVISLLGSSLKNTVQVYFLPMAESFGQQRGTFALATTAFAITYAVAAPLTGALADRLGPGRVLLIGTVSAGFAFLLCALVPSFAVFVAAYGILAAFAYTMLSYVPLGVLVDRLFSEKRKGFFYALLTNGTAAGFILLVPLWTWLDGKTSWNSVLIGLGVLLLCVITPLTALRFRGEAKPAASRSAAGERPSIASALKTSTFARLAGAFFACGATMAFIDVHLMPFMGDMHVHTDLSATSVILLGLFEIGGSLVAGRLCDRGLVKRVLISGYLMRAASMFLISVSTSGFAVILFGCVFGLSYLVTVVATSLWVLKAFPIEVKGTVMGFIWTAHQIGAALSSQFGAYTRDSTGSYLLEIVVTGGLAVLSVGLIAGMPDPDRKLVTP